MPLHSDLYIERDFKVSPLIVDESHDYRIAEMLLNRSIKAMPYHTIFLLTGTLIFKYLADYAGQLALFS